MFESIPGLPKWKVNVVPAVIAVPGTRIDGVLLCFSVFESLGDVDGGAEDFFAM